MRRVRINLPGCPELAEFADPGPPVSPPHHRPARFCRSLMLAIISAEPVQWLLDVVLVYRSPVILVAVTK
jgi:hypothetical protein